MSQQEAKEILAKQLQLLSEASQKASDNDDADNEADQGLDKYDVDEEFKKYKRKAYRKLILSALLAFVLGLLVKFLLLR